MFFTIYVMAQ